MINQSYKIVVLTDAVYLDIKNKQESTCARTMMQNNIKSLTENNPRWH